MRVIDLTQYVAGPFATLLLAELGADVIKVEPPGGDPWRRCTKAGLSTNFDFVNRRKRSVTIDIKQRPGRALLMDLVSGADAVVENYATDVRRNLRISLRALRRANASIVLTSITNFGLEGMYSDWPATELTLEAMGGALIGTGWKDTPPLKLPSYQACYIAGLNAAIATLTSVYGVQAGVARGVQNDVAIHEALLPHWMSPLSLYAYTGRDTGRDARGPAKNQGLTHTVRAKDGYVYLMFSTDDEWEPFARFLGIDDPFASGEWSDPEVRFTRWNELEPHFSRAIATRTKHDWFTAAAEHGYMIAPVDEPNDVIASPQLAARAFFTPAALDDGSSVPCPTLPFSFAEKPLMPNRAPSIGEHNGEVFRDILGLDQSRIESLTAARII